MLRKEQFSNNNDNIYLCLCASLLQFSVNWSSEMEFGVICLKTVGSTQPHAAFWTLEFRSSCFVFSATCMAPSSLPLQRPVLVVSCIKSVWMAGGWGLSFLPSGLSLKHPPCLLYHVPCCWCDNFEPEDVTIITLLRIINSRRSGKQHICPFPVPPANAVKVHGTRFVHLPLMSIKSLLVWLV
jgi:hypothetical protein